MVVIAQSIDSVSQTEQNYLFPAPIAITITHFMSRVSDHSTHLFYRTFRLGELRAGSSPQLLTEETSMHWYHTAILDMFALQFGVSPFEKTWSTRVLLSKNVSEAITSIQCRCRRIPAEIQSPGLRLYEQTKGESQSNSTAFRAIIGAPQRPHVAEVDMMNRPRVVF